MHQGQGRKRTLDYISVIDHDQEAIIVRFRGRVSSHELADLEKKYRKIALIKSYVVVLDCYKAHLNFNITKLYLWFKAFYDEESPEDQELLQAKVIFLLPEGNYQAGQINIAWSACYSNTVALTKPLFDIQAYLESRPYRFWDTA